MNRARRLVGAAVVLCGALLLSGCTPPIPYAWRLNSDGTVDFAFCFETHASRIEVRYARDSRDVFVVSEAGRELEFGNGRVISGPPENWLAKRNSSWAPGDAWDEVKFELFAEDFPAGTVFPGTLSSPDDESDVVESREITRSELREGEWIWDEPGGASCELVESTDYVVEYSGALNRVEFDLLMANADIDAVVPALSERGTVARAIDFQTYLLEDLHAAYVEGMSLAETFEVAFAISDRSDVAIAAQLAVNQLGYEWDASAISGNRWAHEKFPDSIAFMPSATG